MPDRTAATDHGHQEGAADSRYFAPLARGRYLLLTMLRPKGTPVSARVQGIVDGDRAYIRVRSRSGTARHLGRPGPVQVAACNALGLLTYGPSRYAAVRPLDGEEASRVAGRLSRKYPAKRRLRARQPRRTHYELRIP